ncbi:MAG: TonB-dependent receptor [Gammaproteobacteria bacterium]
MDRKFVLTGLGYAILGLALGIFMAASKDHGQLVTHAHIMLIGFVVTFVYALCHKLWLNNTNSKLAMAQYYLHQVGTFFVVLGLFLYYGKFVAAETIDPVLAIASILVLLALILMKVLFIKAGKNA